ncbi:unnamed protein product [Orchesella dallaii]|uniref:Lipase domain-containing protein n=1 Tax=Orchesella dallaii TaxID=48710 RepID=A0ABP1RGB1_9HEXA
MNLKIGPGEFMVHNDFEQVRRTNNGFVRDGIYDINNGIRFRLWTRGNPYLAQEIRVWERRSLYSSYFDYRRLTKIFLHGSNHRSNEKRLDKETAYLRDAYITFGDVNFILVDWTILAAHTNYVTNNGEYIVAERLANFLIFLNNHGTPLESIHLIGHSWGAHVAGLAGKRLGGRIGRITGLDPAGPFYAKPYNYNPKRRLDKADARFVDVIHVDGGNFFSRQEAHLGTKEAIGHVDFYPAGGSRQPSCPPKTPATAKDFYCSHERGIFYFAESIGSPFAFPSCRCESWERFTRNQCECIGDDMAFMGEHCSRKNRGSYFLNVQRIEPYGLGPQTNVVLKSITRAPTIVETETKSALARSQNQTINNLVFNVPSYSSRFYARYYKDDVTKMLLSTLTNFTRYDTKP